VNYVYLVCAAKSPRIMGVFTGLSTLQTWVVNSGFRADSLDVWRFIANEPDVKADKIQWSSGKVIE